MTHMYPKISIITASLNNAAMIDEKIMSVSEQDYQNIEHIIFDGGPTEGTLDILKGLSGSVCLRILPD